ncbi:DUF4175 family protein [Candidatus Phycosocius spiralis]|uniref:TIGR02302 family protein n=1 Tax=Candidatus Phycosocius spiralis TaxID=2815099 RepID=A0ABQ4PUB8_9PROT|nr:DUF4175 family protein [Candidatus Phycosocius spiralis]GIU66530.1 TIGR02302 family protein [Candidatus Phycosocius spiralis]
MLAPASPSRSTQRAVARTIRDDALVKGLRAIWPPLFVLACGALSGSLSQAWPPALISLFAGLIWVLSFYALWRGIRGFQVMTQEEAYRALEVSAGLLELAPLSSAQDQRVLGDQQLWALHQRRLAEVTGQLSKPVNPQLYWRDAGKAALLLFAFGLCVLNPTASIRALHFDVSPVMGDSDLMIEVWAEPPAYTGLPLIRLDPNQKRVALPSGSIITAQVQGARGAPHLHAPWRSQKLKVTNDRIWRGTIALTQSGTLSVSRFGTRAAWVIDLIRDLPPVLKAAEPIKIDPKGRLSIAFSASDDYGLKGAFVRIRPVKIPDGLAGHSTYDTPIPGDASLGDGEAKRLFLDVFDHALTGMEVEARIVVRDGLGQEAASKPTRLIMPQRRWRSNLAAAFQEVRLMVLREARPYAQALPRWAILFEPLISGASMSDQQALGPIKLDLSEPLAGAPPGIAQAVATLTALSQVTQSIGFPDTGQVALHYGLERLSIARHVEDAHSVAPLLWSLANEVEAGTQSPAQQKIAEVKDALKQAIGQGAPSDEIRALTQELREAVGERIQELAQEQASGEGQEAGETNPPITSQDLDDALNAFEDLSANGSRQDALRQLDQLGQVLENLEAGPSGSSGDGGGGPIDRAMRAQTQLNDQTDQLREMPNSDARAKAAEELALQQDELANLTELNAKDSVTNPSDSYGLEQKRLASKAMREAAQALRHGRLTEANSAQMRALQSLRQAAQSKGPAGSQAGRDNSKDPLGRPMPGADDGAGTKIPDGMERRRARDLRHELRRRQSDPSRDQTERDYLDRLLKDD